MINAIGSIGSLPFSNSIAKPAATSAAAGSDFGQMLTQVASDAVNALKGGEAASIGGVTGTQSAQDVVQAVMNAEQALQTAVAVRDKLVAAYQEITRMQI
jgi:flagellar hook-basal body complex protein FliE